MHRFLLKVHYVLTMPFAIIAIFSSGKIHPSYKLGFFRRFGLGFRMFYNTVRVRTGTTYKAHLAMAMKLLELPPDLAGDVLECGTWKGGTATNLSLVCKLTGRKLKIYDSFEGLPEGVPEDREAKYYKKGDYCGALEEVKRNIGRYGAIEVCEFIQGWFDNTLPSLNTPVALAYLDVDLEASLHVCVKSIYPNLVDEGYIFTDEAPAVDYVALFYSEKWWKLYFDRTPPGLIGAGTGLPLGEYYIGPYSDLDTHPLQHASTGAYMRKTMSGVWTYYPDEGQSPS